jgi:hypothetical protein
MHPPAAECSYTSAMPSPPPVPPDRPPATEEPERFGPLVLRRLVKDDGRALILFSRADDGGER